MPRSKRAIGLILGALVAVMLAILGPELYAQGRMVTTTGVVFVRGIIGSLPITVANIVATSTDGLLLQNTTAAVVGVPVQYSPRLRLCGTAWKTDATTASETDCWLMENRPVSAAGTTTSVLAVAASIAGGSYTDRLTLTSGGTLRVGDGTVAAPSLSFISTGGTGFYQPFANYIGTSVSGLNEFLWGPGTQFMASTGTLQWTVGATNAAVDLRLARSAAKVLTLDDGAAGAVTLKVLSAVAVGTNLTLRGTTPTVTGGGSTCGTSAPSIAGTDSAGKVTTGSVAPTICVVTFSSAWANAPSCFGANETTGNLLRPTSTTTTLTLTGTMVAGDVLAYHCLGY